MAAEPPDDSKNTRTLLANAIGDATFAEHGFRNRSGARNPHENKLEWVNEIPVSNVKPSPKQMNLHFVAETGTARPQGAVRDIIRSQARRKPKTCKEKPNHTSEKVTSENTVRAPSIDAGDWIAIQKGNSPRRLPDPHGTKGNHVLDPFSQLPSVAPRELETVQALLKHYDSVFRHSYAPMNPRDEYLPWAISDSTTLHSTLFISALSLDCLHGRPFGPNIFYHRGKTIQLLNKRLENASWPASDEIIVTVSCLTLFETLAASRKTAKIHMDGLESMIQSRGGLQGMEDGIAKKLATWVDSGASILLSDEPRFPLDTIEKPQRPFDCVPFSALALRCESRLNHLTHLTDLSHQMMEAYWNLRRLSQVKDEFCYNLKSTCDIDSYSNTLEYLERQLITILQSKELSSPNQRTSILHLFSNAAILHIYIFMRDLPKGLPIRWLIAERLRIELKSLDVQALLAPYPEMMLWILILGGNGAVGSPNLEWFATTFADACVTLGIRGGDEVAITLREFFWSELYRSPVTKPFWNDVARRQGVVGGYEVQRLTDHVSAHTFNSFSKP